MLFPMTLVGSYPQPEWLIDLARDIAFGKLKSLVSAAAALREEYGV